MRESLTLCASDLADMQGWSISKAGQYPRPGFYLSSNCAGSRPVLKNTTGSSSYSPSSTSPDVENATTPALVVARRSAVRRADSGDLQRIGVSAFSRARLPWVEYA